MARTTLWVRPGTQDVHYAGPYGNEDGSDYDNAVPGLKQVPWSTPELEVIVADTHLPIWNRSTSPTIASYANVDLTDYAGVEGSPLIVRGDASVLDARAKNAVVLGVFRDVTADTLWQQRPDLGPGMWSRLQPYYQGGDGWWIRMIGAGATLDDYTPIEPASSLQACIDTEDRQYSPQGYGLDAELFVHIPAGEDANAVVFRSPSGYGFSISRARDILFYGLTFVASRPHGSNYQAVEYRRCSFRYVKSFSLRDRFENLAWHRCRFQHMTDAVYFHNAVADGIPVNVRFSNCEASDLGNRGWNFSASDNHAFTCQGCDGFYVDGCLTERTGHPIVAYSWSRCLYQRNFQVTRTVCRDPMTGTGFTWNGIAFNPQRPAPHTNPDWANWGPENTRGCKVERCVVRGEAFDAAIRNGMIMDYDGADAELRVVDCLIEDLSPTQGVGIGLYNNNYEGRGSTVYARGNTMRRAGHSFIAANVWGTPAKKAYQVNGGINSDNNTFIHVGSNPTYFFDGSANEFRTFAQWQAESPLFDPNSTLNSE